MQSVQHLSRSSFKCDVTHSSTLSSAESKEKMLPLHRVYDIRGESSYWLSLHKYTAVIGLLPRARSREMMTSLRSEQRLNSTIGVNYSLANLSAVHVYNLLKILVCTKMCLHQFCILGYVIDSPDLKIAVKNLSVSNIRSTYNLLLINTALLLPMFYYYHCKH